MLAINNKIPADILANEILKETKARFQELLNITVIDKQLEIMSEIEKNSKIAMLLGNNKACLVLAKSYNWAIENLELDTETLKNFQYFYNKTIYIGSELGDDECLKIKEKISQEITDIISEEIQAIQKTQTYCKKQVLYNSEQVKENIYKYYLDEIKEDLDDETFPMMLGMGTSYIGCDLL